MSFLRHPVSLELTGAWTADIPRLPGLIAGPLPLAVLTVKGYDAESNRAAIRVLGAGP